MRWERFAFLLVGGFALTAFSLHQPSEPTSRWSGGVLLIAESDPPAGGAFAARWAPAGLYPLAPGPTAESIDALEARQPRVARALRRDRQTKVIAVPVLADFVDETMLARGRLPVAGREEVLAGHELAGQDDPVILGRTFEVVGVLETAPSPLGRAYLLERHESNARFFQPASDVRPVLLLTAEEAAAHLAADDGVYAGDEITTVAGVTRVPRSSFYAAVLGFLALVAGGAGLLIAGADALARRGPSVVSGALEEMERHRRLLVGLHVAFFGTLGLAMLFVYEFPLVQDMLLVAVGEQITAESGLLAMVGRAYLGGSIPEAAAATFALNFVVGSIGMITLPSFVMPFWGVGFALFRALGWGLLLAPARSDLAVTMVPHNLTLFLEGEGYVLAAFFVALVPISLLRRGSATLADRVRGAVVLNLKGNLLVGAVLLVAAVYEATEVILLVQ